MRKICIVPFSFLVTVIVVAQKKLPNSKIGKNEIEITLLNLRDDSKGFIANKRKVLGGEVVYRLSWKKYTKVGIGVLVAADYEKLGSDLFGYGAVFSDVTQFIGKRQKWSVSGQLGHGMYNRKYEFDDSIAKGFDKYAGGMYYSISVNYRAIASKKILIIISPFFSLRNFRRTTVTEYYSPPSVQKNKEIEKRSGVGLRFGVVL